jgi:hypothetical protein
VIGLLQGATARAAGTATTVPTATARAMTRVAPTVAVVATTPIPPLEASAPEAPAHRLEQGQGWAFHPALLALFAVWPAGPGSSQPAWRVEVTMQIDRSLSTLVTVAVPVASPPGQAPDARADRAERLPTELAAALARPTWLSGPRVQAGLLVLAPMLLLLFARYFVSSTDPDYWWHVRTGQYIVETGTLPRAEIYSYTVPDRPWVTHEWLAEVLLYVVQQRFGYVGNVVLFAALAALTALVVYATCRVRGLGEPSAAMLMLWAVGIGMGSANVRPQLLTTLMLAVCALLLTLYLRGQTRAIWPYPLLMALWVNLHDG